jgi:hypothetical protein
MTDYDRFIAFLKGCGSKYTETAECHPWAPEGSRTQIEVTDRKWMCYFEPFAFFDDHGKFLMLHSQA